MPRRLEEDGNEDESGWGRDEAQNDEAGDEDEEATILCPHCKRHIHEDSERCPYCEQYISEEEVSPSRTSWWIIIGALICLDLVYRWIMT